MIIALGRRIDVNRRPSANLFKLNSSVAEIKLTDQSQLTVTEVAPSVYHVGQSSAYTTFFDLGDFFVGIGGYAGLGQRFAKLQEIAQSEKPLKYQIITHHHTDHLDGMRDAYELGATLVTTKRNADILMKYLGIDIPNGRLMLADGGASIQTASNTIVIREISTSHADSSLIAYGEKQKLLFVADHFYSQWDEGVEPGSRNAVTLKRELDRLGLDIELFTGSHSMGARTHVQFEQAVRDAYGPCVSGRPICS